MTYDELTSKIKEYKRKVFLTVSGITIIFYIFHGFIIYESSSEGSILLSEATFFILLYMCLQTGIMIIFNYFEKLLNKMNTK